MIYKFLEQDESLPTSDQRQSCLVHVTLHCDLHKQSFKKETCPIFISHLTNLILNAIEEVDHIRRCLGRFRDKILSSFIFLLMHPTFLCIRHCSIANDSRDSKLLQTLILSSLKYLTNLACHQSTMLGELVSSR